MNAKMNEWRLAHAARALKAHSPGAYDDFMTELQSYSGAQLGKLLELPQDGLQLAHGQGYAKGVNMVTRIMFNCIPIAKEFDDYLRQQQVKGPTP